MRTILVALMLAVPAAPLPPCPDLPKLQGTWVVVRQQIGMSETGRGLGEFDLVPLAGLCAAIETSPMLGRVALAPSCRRFNGL